MVSEESTQHGRLRAAAKRAGYDSAADLAEAMGMKEATVRSAMNGTRPLTAQSADRYAAFLQEAPAWLLYGRKSGAGPSDIPRNGKKKVVATRDGNSIASQRGDRRAEPLYEPLTELVFVIGSVQAGAWREAYQLPEGEWMEMRLAADPRYPGIARYGLRNVGQSMNKRCSDGGIWVFVRFHDLTGLGPQPGNYLIVERHRAGEVEATCKRLEIGPGGVPQLCPDSTDPSYAPIPLRGTDPDVEEIRVIGLVTEVVDRV